MFIDSEKTVCDPSMTTGHLHPAITEVILCPLRRETATNESALLRLHVLIASDARINWSEVLGRKRLILEDNHPQTYPQLAAS